MPCLVLQQLHEDLVNQTEASLPKHNETWSFRFALLSFARALYRWDGRFHLVFGVLFFYTGPRISNFSKLLGMDHRIVRHGFSCTYQKLTQTCSGKIKCLCVFCLGSRSGLLSGVHWGCYLWQNLPKWLRKNAAASWQLLLVCVIKRWLLLVLQFLYSREGRKFSSVALWTKKKKKKLLKSSL